MVNLTAMKAKRMARGVTQREVAKSVGVTGRVVWAVETGYNPASENMQTKLADYFGCERSELFDSKTKRARPFAE